MKKLTLSIFAIMAMNTFALAASSGTYDADGPNSYKNGGLSSNYQSSKYYVGIAYGLTNAKSDQSAEQPVVIRAETELELNTVMLQAGYQVNEYIAVEGRYWRAFGDIDYTDTSSTHPQYNDSGTADSDGEDVYGIYVKPMYPVTQELNVYALVGYTFAADDVFPDDNGFSWGLGTSYQINNEVSFFVDYTSLYDNDTSDVILGYDVNADVSIDSWNFGLSYKF